MFHFQGDLSLRTKGEVCAKIASQAFQIVGLECEKQHLIN